MAGSYCFYQVRGTARSLLFQTSVKAEGRHSPNSGVGRKEMAADEQKELAAVMAELSNRDKHASDWFGRSS